MGVAVHHGVRGGVDEGGDAHPGNMYFHGGKAGLLDWQAVRRGHPSRELA
ncbi:hypothetical protein MAHJHV33_48390 [Mycobacterium avium subsp. hominissuis]